MIVTTALPAGAPVGGVQNKAPSYSTRIQKLAIIVLVNSGKIVTKAAIGLVKIIVLPLQVCFMMVLIPAEKVASLFSGEKHVRALKADIKELHGITRNYGVPYAKEILERADHAPHSPECMRIEPIQHHQKSIPILYCPGYLDNPESLRDSCRRIACLTGCPVYIPKSRKVFQSVIEHAKDVSRVRARMLLDTKQEEYIFIGHSMGGLSTGRALQEPRGQCKLWVTVATPLQGTPLARIAPGSCGRDMQPGSRVISELQASKEVASVPSLHIFTSMDRLVPLLSAQPFEKPFSKTHLCSEPCGHLSVRSHPEVEMRIVDEITNLLNLESIRDPLLDNAKS